MHGDLWLLVACLVPAGLIAGMLAGLLGIGGGIVLVPVLFTVFGQVEVAPAILMQMAVGTSLGTIVVSSTSSAWAHYKKGAVERSIVVAWAPFIVIGAVSGGTLAARVPSRMLEGVFVVALFLMAMRLLCGKDAGQQTHSALRKRPWMQVPWMQGIGVGIGLLSSLLGIGGATLSVPVQILMGQPMKKAVGTAAALGVLIGFPAALSYIWNGWGMAGRPPYSAGFVNLAACLVLMPLTALMAPLGAKLAHHLPPVFLKRLFAIFLLLVCGRMALQ